MPSIKKAVARKAVKTTAKHTAHGTVAKLRRRPLRTASLIGIGCAAGAAAGWAVTRRRARGGEEPGASTADASPQPAGAPIDDGLLDVAPSPPSEADLADLQLVEEEAAAAAAEAAQIGGAAPIESDDPAQQPLIEAGQGESEGFELAEAQLRDIASHGDQHRFPDRDVPPPEEAEGAERGEADQVTPADR